LLLRSKGLRSPSLAENASTIPPADHPRAAFLAAFAHSQANSPPSLRGADSSQRTTGTAEEPANIPRFANPGTDTVLRLDAASLPDFHVRISRPIAANLAKRARPEESDAVLTSNVNWPLS